MKVRAQGISVTAASLSVAIGLVGMSSSADAAILALSNSGTVYSVDTTTLQATVFASVVNLAGQNPNSPNALGHNGQLFYTSFGNDIDNPLYRGNTQIAADLTIGANDGFSIAAADVSGTDYYFLDRNGMLGQVSNINGSPSAVSSRKIMTGATLGDLAILNGVAYVSYASNFGSVNLAAGNLTPIGPSNLERMVGLAFEGNQLFGFTAGGTLYGINTGTGAQTELGQILKQDGTTLTELTDGASQVPLPAAAWLLLSGLAGLFGVSRRRAA